MDKNSLKLIKKDLLTLSDQDLNILYEYYSVYNVSSLASKIWFKKYNSAFLPLGTVFNAVENNNFNDFMEFLNDPNFDPNIRYPEDPDNFTLLMKCVLNSKKNGEKYIEALLKKKNLDLNLKDNDGWTALIFASSGTRGSTLTTVKLLIDAGADVNLKENEEWTALMMAARTSNTTSSEETVRLLIDAGSNVDLQNDLGWTALMLASRESKKESTPETVKMLIDAGANVDLQNKHGSTALHLASEYSTMNVVKMLLEAGADPNIKNSYDKTAIDLTNVLSIQLLLLKGGSMINNNPKLIEFKISELEIEIFKYKKLLDELELNLLKDDKNCNNKELNLKGIENLEKCLKNIKQMIKLNPKGKKAKKIAKKYIQTDF